MVKIFDVISGSAAAESGILPGDYLISINGHNINDILDYSFYITVKKIELRLHRMGEVFEITIKKNEYADIGLQFETFLMDEKQSCRNKCIFCFVDQNPPGMRETLYFKDDDTRLSFLHGNYVTLTNLSEEDISRIEMMKTSPINISVHTTDPDLRIRMLNNKKAGHILDIMRRFAKANIKMNCQIVLCKNVNDKKNLDKTMEDLTQLYPGVNSVSVVPAGITCHRKNLFPLEMYTPEESKAIINQVEEFSSICKKKYGTRIFFCADELYIRAGLPYKNEKFYEGYPQIENGVGMLTSMRTEFDEELKNLNKYDLNKKRNVSIATGIAAFEFISGLVDILLSKCPNLYCSVYPIKNNFYGQNITVAGLIVGSDIKEQLAGKKLGKYLFLPASMIKHSETDTNEPDLFLDGTTPANLEWALDTEIRFIENNGAEFIRKILSD